MSLWYSYSDYCQKFYEILNQKGNIIYDIVSKCNGLLTVSTLRKLEELSLKCDKASLDIKFLSTLKRFRVVPKS